MSKVDVLLGLQWGDEGKGKIVDVLTPDYDVIARFQGGPNAGHTIEFNGIKHVLHIIPSGIFHEDKINVIGNGVLIEPRIFQQEIGELSTKGVDATKNLFISKKAHLILPSHRLLDAANEKAKGNAKIGSTLKGIGPAYTDKIARTGLRVGDIKEFDFREKYELLKVQHLQMARTLNFDIDSFRIDKMTLSEYEQVWLESLDTLKRFQLINSEYFINRCITEGKRVLAEGAQGSMLDIDFGSYPFVTSSSTITAGVCSGLGVAPSRIGRVMGITKAYCTRVGSGPFPTELFDEIGNKLCEVGHEYGATTGRPRRCGWIDIPALRYACMLNGVTDLFITKPDVMNDFDEIKMCTSYEINGKLTDEIPFEFNAVEIEPQLVAHPGWKQSLEGISNYSDLPYNLRSYLNAIQEATGVSVKAVSISPDRKDVLFK
ncbi:MAG: adenylosuccinate synthase [Bacteroidales bacterium]|nr:adenylosuccinate synthase [Bacteroidales bacterium]MBR3413405.1 adenylosuccinate synthase [Bacteroidales bacterium]